MGRLSNSEFLSKFGGILEENKGKSSVYVTQKRLSHAPIEDNETGIRDLSSNVIENDGYAKNTAQYPVLIRLAMNGDGKEKNKNKISTVVESGSLDQFWTEYVHIIKIGFVGLKKKDKKKAKKGGKVSK